MSEHLADSPERISGVGILGMIAMANEEALRLHPDVNVDSYAAIRANPQAVIDASVTQLKLLDGFADCYPEETWDTMSHDDARIRFTEYAEAAARNRGE